MEKKKITVTIKDKDGKVLLEYSEPVEISRGAMENITWIKKGVWTIKELLNINISQELDRAREEGYQNCMDDIWEKARGLRSWTEHDGSVSAGDIEAGLREAYLEIEEELSKLNNKVIWKRKIGNKD